MDERAVSIYCLSMKFSEHPLSQIERDTLTKVIIESMRAIDGTELRLPLISGAVVANAMYHVEVLHHRALQPSSYNVVFTLRNRRWTMKIPGDMDMRYGKADLGFDHAELVQGAYEHLKHDLTLAAMFLE